MATRIRIHDQILKLFERKARKWKNRYLEERTETKLRPKTREMQAQILLLTTSRHKYSALNGCPQQTEIIPPTVYNLLTIESRIGNTEGTGYAVKTETIEEGNPRNIPLGSLEERLERLYREARRESYRDFVECYFQTNAYELRKHQEIESRISGIRERRSIPRVDAFYHLEPIKQPNRFLGENNNSKIPGPAIQQLLLQISRALIGDNEIGKNGFQAEANISVINETWRYANSEGSIIRTDFNGHAIRYVIRFHLPRGGKRIIDWTHGIAFPKEIRKYKRFLIRKAEELNLAYNEFFNNREAVSIPAGLWEVYLEPSTTSTHIHESVVHACSSEAIAEHLKFRDEPEINENVFTIKDLGSLVANPNLQIIYNPRKRSRDGKLYWGGMIYDHETIEARKFHIIRDGRLTSLLADRSDAYLFYLILGKRIVKPGSSRFGVSEDLEIETQNPRTSVLEVKWSEKITRERLWEIFLDRIRKYGRVPFKAETRKAGLWLKNGYHGEYSEEGFSKVIPCAGYLVFEDGEYLPIRDLIFTTNSPRSILKNIQAMALKREHITGECAIEGYRVRESIFCSSSIISDLEVKTISQVLPRYV